MSGKGIYDIHCHIVPGVDDGATDIEETGKLLRMEYEQGVRTIIATPHFRFRMFETSAEKVKEQFKLVEKAAAEVASDLHVYLGCEFHTNMEMISMLRENKVMTMAGSRYVLTEFSHNSEENYIRERLSALLSGGYKPIVAHIERYEATRTSMDFVEKLEEEKAFLMTVDMMDQLLKEESKALKRYDEDMENKSMVLLEPPSVDQRIISQYSYFSVIPPEMEKGEDDYGIEKFLGITNNTVKYIIDAKLKWQIRDMLDQMNINERIVYPRLDGLTKWLTRHYYVRK